MEGGLTGEDEGRGGSHKAEERGGVVSIERRHAAELLWRPPLAFAGRSGLLAALSRTADRADSETSIKESLGSLTSSGCLASALVDGLASKVGILGCSFLVLPSLPSGRAAPRPLTLAPVGFQAV